jgi:hypothetical protein
MTAISGGTLDAAGLLDVWERTSDLARPWRELAILELSGAGAAEEVARLPVGTRDGLVLDVLEVVVGPGLAADVSCPACGEHLEVRLDVDRVRLPGSAPAVGHEITVDGWSVDFRLPDSLAVGACRDVDGDPEPNLLERCVERVRHGDEPADIDGVPAAVRRAIASRMAELDPQAEILIDVACPTCGQRWPALFDPVDFLLRVLDDRARHVLLEVDQLARAYGWREVDVLALPPRRRRHYLELATQ